MKKILIPISALFVTSLIHAQLSPTENYVYSKTYLSDPTLPNPKSSETVQYFDGLGRPKQVVSVGASPMGRDVVTHIVYDEFGRQVRDYLPVPQSVTLNGAIVPTPLANAPATPLGTEKIYSEKTLENSPLDRILQQKQVGIAWSDKPLNFSYDAVTAADAVKKFTTSTTWENGATKSIASNAGFYLDNQLYKNTVTDEDGNKTIEFKNGKGQLVLARKVVSPSENADTYYVYNEYDDLAFVVPPLLDKIQSWSQEDKDNLAYEYRYDGRGRLVEKKLPGKGREFMVYDKADRLILSQDANLKGQNKWLITKYDMFGRVASTGFLAGGERQARQNEINNIIVNETRSTSGFTRNGMTVYYTETYFTGEIPTILTVNYYDTFPGYDFNPDFPATILGEQTLTDNQLNDGRSTKGLPVMSLVKNIEDDNWTKNYSYYDTRGRVVGSYSINHLGGRTQSNVKLDFGGAVQQTVTRHKRLNTDTDRIITENFIYDGQNRLLVHKHQVDSNPEEILAQNKYNELSQLETKKVGGVNPGSPLQTIDYKYNIRGWMTKINDPVTLNGKLFGYEIKYNNPASSSITPGRFNGNIAEIDWKNSTEDVLKRYNYEYDYLNRLKNAFYKEPTTGESTTFDEYLTYDLNGNIKTLKRKAVPVSGGTSTLVDDLTYNYEGNRLYQVIESSLNDAGYEGGNNFIEYDLNGSMINMKDKGIQDIAYNHLSLADRYSITQNNPLGTSITFGLEYLYRADGTKVRKTYSTGGGRGQAMTYKYTDYLDGFQYSFSEKVAPCPWCRTSVAYEQEAFKEPIPVDPTPFPIGWLLDFVPTSEGFYSFTENRYIYQYRDHLGNARVSFAKNAGGSLEVTDTNNYYAFGMNHIGGIKSSLGAYQNYKYNGKELQESGMYDYGARMYMPDLGRWGVVDPLAEKMPSWSPYVMSFNNPVRFGDPTGMAPDDFVQRKDGSIYWDKNANSQATTKAGSGDTWLGKELTFRFNSYIDGKLWDGPLSGVVDASGVKLTSTLKLTAGENDAGELTSLSGSFESMPGDTPIGAPRMFYPGEGGSNNVFGMTPTSTGINTNFEQHASVSSIEEFGLNSISFKIVDVAQKLNINYNSSNGNLSVDAYTNVFPSASLTVSGSGNTSKLMQYNQPSFPGTHSAMKGVSGMNPFKDSRGNFVRPSENTVTRPKPINDFSYYPSRFYKRN